MSQLNLIRVAPHRAAIYTSDIREANSVKPDHASRNKHDQVFNRLVATPVISSPLNCPSVRTRTRIQFSTIGLHHRAWILHFRRPLVGWWRCLSLLLCLSPDFGDRLTDIIILFRYHRICLCRTGQCLTTLTFISFGRHFPATVQNEFRSSRRRSSQLQAHAVSLQRSDLYPASERRCGSCCVPDLACGTNADFSNS